MTAVTLIGYGRWGRHIARNLRELGVLAAICDTDPTRRAAAAAALPGIALLDSLDAISPDHAVAIAAPAVQHEALVRKFLLRDQHVFVEKPLALSVQAGNALAELAARRGKLLMVGHLLHYHPAITRLSELVATGVLGRLRCLYSHRLNLGTFRREESSLWSFAPHDIAVLLRIVGHMPERVIATGGHYLHPRIADTTLTSLTWASGVQAHIHVSWLHPFKEQRLVVVGEAAMAVFDDRLPQQEKLVLYRHGVAWHDGVPEPIKAQAEPVAIEPTEPLRNEMQAFLDAIDDPAKPPFSDAQEGVRVLCVLQAAQRSLDDGGAVQTPEIPGKSASQSSSVQGPTVHDSAVVDPQASVGARTRIWHFCHVMAGAWVGEDCVLGQNVFVQAGAVIGDRVRLQNNVSVYDGVVLEDDVFCGPSCVFTNVSRPRSHVTRRGEFEVTRVGKGATIGANATIVCGHSVGHHAFVAAGAVVTRDLRPHGLYAGIPARQTGWVCECGERLALPDKGAGQAACHRCASSWSTDGDALTAVADGSSS